MGSKAPLGQLYHNLYINKTLNRTEEVIKSCGIVDERIYFFNILCKLRLGMFEGLDELIYSRIEKLEEKCRKISSLKHIQQNDELEYIKEDILRYYDMLCSLYFVQNKLFTSYGIFTQHIQRGNSFSYNNEVAEKIMRLYTNHFLYLSDKDLGTCSYRKYLKTHVILHRNRRFSIPFETVLKIISENFDKARTYYNHQYEKIFRCQGLIYKTNNGVITSYEYLRVVYAEKDDPNSIITIHTLDGCGDMEYFDLTPYAYENKKDRPDRLSGVKTNRLEKFRSRQKKMNP